MTRPLMKGTSTAVAIYIWTSSAALPLPTSRQLDFLEDVEFTQFLHFGISTFWEAPESFLRGSNPTYHDCTTTDIDHSKETGAYWPCLDPLIFNPAELDVDSWMAATKALGIDEV